MPRDGRAKLFFFATVGCIIAGACMFPCRVMTAHSFGSRGKDDVRLSLLPVHKEFTGSDAREYGWQRLKEVLSADPTNPASHSWQDWSTKCFVATGVTPDANDDPQMNLSKQCAWLRPKVSGEARRGTGGNLGLQTRYFWSAATMTPQDQNEDHLGSVLFNATAARFILTQRLDIPVGGGTDVIKAVAGKAQSLDPAFPSNSVVVKAVWEVISNEGTEDKPFWPLRVYDPNNIQWMNSDPSTGGLAPIEGETPHSGWSTKLSLNANEGLACPFKAGPPSADLEEAGAAIPINCFIHKAVSDRTLGVSNIAAQGTSSSPNYYLLLVGLHVARKDGNDWKWTTFWLTNRPTVDTAHFEGQKENFPDIPPQYAYFAMDTSNANAGDMYNPYQEGPQGLQSTQTKCADCHGRAAVELGLDTTAGKGISCQGPKPTSDLYWTDSIWSLATARNTRSDISFWTHRSLLVTQLKKRAPRE
jgi:hypothetical protein